MKTNTVSDNTIPTKQPLLYNTGNLDGDLENYSADKIAGNLIASSNFREYIRAKYYPGESYESVIVAIKGRNIKALTLHNVDFGGCIIEDVVFQSNDLSGAVFCDSYLKNVQFVVSTLTNVDFRGVDLANLYFDQSYHELTDLNNPDKTQIKGIKFSSTEAMQREYLREIQSIDEDLRIEKQKFDQAKEKNLQELTKELNANTSYGQWVGLASPSEKYIEIEQKLKKENGKFFDKKGQYPIDPSLVHIMGLERNFDPTYIRHSSKEERDVKKQHIPVTRKEIEEYLEQIKKSPELTLNEYITQRAIDNCLKAQKADTHSGENVFKVQEGAKIIADCAGVDLSKIDFSNAKLTGACFAKATMEACKFVNADLSRASFEGAKLKNASFEKVNAERANFFSSNLNSAEIKDSNFKSAFIARSKAESAMISGSNFDNANISNGKWSKVGIIDSSFNNGDLTELALDNARVERVEIKRAILTDAILRDSKIISSNFQGSLMHRLQAQNASFQDSMLKDVEAPFADFSKVDFGTLANLEGAHLENAILEYIQAEQINFTKAHLEQASLKGANLKQATLNDANLAFASLEEAVLEQAKGHNVDMTGCNLKKANAKEVVFTEAILKDIKAEEANFSKAVLEGADLRGANLHKAILEGVDLKKADLRNANLREANLRQAEIEGAKVNAATDLSGADIADAKGKLAGNISLQEQKNLSEEADKAKNAGFLQKNFSKALNFFASGAQKVADFIEHPIGPKMARIIGAVLAATIVGGIVASAVLTGGLSLAVAVPIIGGCAIAGGAAGHYAAKKIGVGTVAAGVAGGMALGPVGAALGIGAYQVCNDVVKATTGVTIEEGVAKGLNAAANNAKEMAKSGEVSAAGEAHLAEQEKCKKEYVASKKEDLAPSLPSNTALFKLAMEPVPEINQQNAKENSQSTERKLSHVERLEASRAEASQTQTIVR